MSIAAQINLKPKKFVAEQPCFVQLDVTDESIIATFSDGNVVSIPLWWSWRLEQASPSQRHNYEIIGAGHTVYWPDVDEHLSVQGFLNGTPAPRATTSQQAKTTI